MLLEKMKVCLIYHMMDNLMGKSMVILAHRMDQMKVSLIELTRVETIALWMVHRMARKIDH